MIGLFASGLWGPVRQRLNLHNLDMFMLIHFSDEDLSLHFDAAATARQHNGVIPDLHDAPCPPDEEGWVRGANGELLLWVPEEYRVDFCTPNVRMVGRPSVRVDFSKSVHGTKWAECYAPRSR